LNAGFILLFLFSNIMTQNQLVDYPIQDQEQRTWNGLMGSGDYEATNVTEAYEIGKILAREIPEGSRVLIGLEDAFPMELAAADPGLFMDHTDPDFRAAVLYPPDYVDYVLVPKNEGKSGLNVINRFHETLHSQGAVWAERVDILPDTDAKWKLYKVRRTIQAGQP